MSQEALNSFLYSESSMEDGDGVGPEAERKRQREDADKQEERSESRQRRRLVDIFERKVIEYSCRGKSKKDISCVKRVWCAYIDPRI